MLHVGTCPLGGVWGAALPGNLDALRLLPGPQKDTSVGEIPGCVPRGGVLLYEALVMFVIHVYKCIKFALL